MVPLQLPHRLILVRHGETDWNREGRLQGGQDIPLNDLGRRQAAEAAGRLKALEPAYADLDYIASPMQRARETIDILRRELAMPAGAYALDERLRELTFGSWEGFTWRDIRKAERAEAHLRERDKWGYVPPGGESYRMLAERVRPVLEGLRRETVIVSHGGVARAVLALVGAVKPREASMVEIWQGKLLVVSGNRADWV
ncbi:histidine phosphatase family protein [Bosea sp. (in: a-proteobacteria)]|uniref:histidine phosphatase family protein n=1 Tax=Bosea sp. (in: a-proteobacteria) TaxID=1871050 RepID=UPI002609502B|nr:histidine phosphatase family protein [Bosea sp. (in: a-proteobacteria)]MCO5090714.1 histidine phosphatase family protein [Bosea sp. (in: a-proteobacteria)]